MEITVETKLLSQTLGSMISIVDRTTVNPIFGNVKISTEENNQVQFYAINTESAISKFINVTIAKPGSTTVSIRMLYDILRRILDENIKLQYLPEEHKLNITGKTCSFILPTISVEHYPKFGSYTVEHEFNIEKSQLSSILENTQFAMSNEEARYNLNGVCLKYNQEQSNLVAIATDCHRLAISSTNLSIQNNKEVDLIIPKRTVTEIIKFAKNSASEKLKIGICNNMMVVQEEFGIMISKLIDGTFPKYEELIPTDNPCQLIFNSTHLADIINRVSAITSNLTENMRVVQISLNQDIVQIKTASSVSSNCSAKEVIVLENYGYTYQGNEMDIGFNPKYILDICSALKDQDLRILLKDSYSSALVLPKNNNNDKFIVMPLRVPESNASKL